MYRKLTPSAQYLVDLQIFREYREDKPFCPCIACVFGIDGLPLMGMPCDWCSDDTPMFKPNFTPSDTRLHVLWANIFERSQHSERAVMLTALANYIQHKNINS